MQHILSWCVEYRLTPYFFTSCVSSIVNWYEEDEHGGQVKQNKNISYYISTRVPLV